MLRQCTGRGGFGEMLRQRGGMGGGALWPPCPPACACGYGLLLYLRPKGTAPHAPASAGKASGGASFFYPEPSPAVAGRPFRVGKGGRSRRRRPGDTERKGLPAAAGPVRSPA